MDDVSVGRRRRNVVVLSDSSSPPRAAVVRRRRVISSDSSSPPLDAVRVAEARVLSRHPGVATIGEGVAVRKSTIEAAGNGLFATRAFRSGELVTKFQGRRVGRDVALALRAAGEGHYIFTLSAQHSFIDGIRTPRRGAGGGSFANHGATSASRNAKLHVIVDRATGVETAWVKATRAIAVGDEILVSYGRNYFDVNAQAMRA